jgi:hypothetical protein
MDTPKDLYGIPILPSFAELGNNTEDKTDDRSTSPFSECTAEAFDDATYGVWSTIMNNSNDDLNGENDKISNIFLNKGGGSSGLQANFADASHGNLTIPDSQMSSSSTLSQLSKPILPPVRQERLEEFISAFLGMSVFDVADVWMPTSGDDAQYLRHVMSVTASDQNETLNEFKKATTGSILKIWSGAVGKAYGSGNAVWTNKQVRLKTNLFGNLFLSAELIILTFFQFGCYFCCFIRMRLLMMVGRQRLRWQISRLLSLCQFFLMESSPQLVFYVVTLWFARIQSHLFFDLCNKLCAWYGWV